MKTFTTVIIFLSLIALAVNSTNHTIDFTENELEDDVLELFTGDFLIIKFHERPSTGFVWQKFNVESNYVDPILEMDENSYYPSQSKSIGGLGLKEFTFTAVNIGTETYSFVNGRPWEVSTFVQGDGLFDETSARDNGIVFTLVTLRITVSQDQTRFNLV